MEENIKMEDLLAQEGLSEKSDVQGGRINDLPIAAFTDDSVLIDMGAKMEAIIPKSEFPADKIDALKVGDKISVFVSGTSFNGGMPRVSYKRAQDITNWAFVKEKKNANEPVPVRIVKQTKGGFIAELNNLQVFLPLSQADIKPVRDPLSILDTEIEVLIIEADKSKNNVVVSRRKILENQRQQRKREILEKLKVGDIVSGRVSSIEKYGAFIDIGGIDALMRENEFSWDKSEKMAKNLQTGQELDLKVISIDEKEGKISLSRKALLAHPWDGIEERFPEGSTVEGIVSSFTDFGMFVRIDKGVDGLVHISELSWTEKLPQLKTKYKKGDLVKTVVLSADRSAEKLSLSIKCLQPNPWEEAVELYKPGMRLKGLITHMAPFGAFVGMPNALEGLVHVSDIDWIKKIKHPKDLLKVGQEIEFIVKGVNPKEEKIILSIKELKQNPFAKYRQGMKVECVVKKILNFGAFASLEDGVDVFLHISEIFSGNEDPKYKLKHPSECIQEGQRINAKIIKVNQEERSIEISTKKYERDMEKEEIKKYMNKSSNPTLGDLFSADESE